MKIGLGSPAPLGYAWVDQQVASVRFALLFAPLFTSLREPRWDLWQMDSGEGTGGRSGSVMSDGWLSRRLQEATIGFWVKGPRGIGTRGRY